MKRGTAPLDRRQVEVRTIASVVSDFDVYRLPKSRKLDNVFFSPGGA
jgi:hypothetical protein